MTQTARESRRYWNFGWWLRNPNPINFIQVQVQRYESTQLMTSLAHWSGEVRSVFFSKCVLLLNITMYSRCMWTRSTQRNRLSFVRLSMCNVVKLNFSARRSPRRRLAAWCVEFRLPYSGCRVLLLLLLDITMARWIILFVACLLFLFYRQTFAQTNVSEPARKS